MIFVSRWRRLVAKYGVRIKFRLTFFVVKRTLLCFQYMLIDYFYLFFNRKGLPNITDDLDLLVDTVVVNY